MAPSKRRLKPGWCVQAQQGQHMQVVGRGCACQAPVLGTLWRFIAAKPVCTCGRAHCLLPERTAIHPWSGFLMAHSPCGLSGLDRPLQRSFSTRCFLFLVRLQRRRRARCFA